MIYNALHRKKFPSAEVRITIEIILSIQRRHSYKNTLSSFFNN